MYPLLTQGIFSNANGTNFSNVVQAGPATQQWSNVLTTGRGNLEALDLVLINDISNAVLVNMVPSQVNLSLGGKELISSAMATNYLFNSYAGRYMRIPINSPGGQNLSLIHSIPSGCSAGIVALAYYMNKANFNERLLNALNYSALKQRVQDFWRLFNTGLAYNAEKLSITVPTGRGNVVGMQLIASFSDTSSQLIERPELIVTVLVNGNEVLQDVPALIALPQSSRNVIYPIFIPGGMKIEVLTSSVTLPTLVGVAWIGVRLFYDNEVSGGNPYGL